MASVAVTNVHACGQTIQLDEVDGTDEVRSVGCGTEEKGGQASNVVAPGCDSLCDRR